MKSIKSRRFKEMDATSTMISEEAQKFRSILRRYSIFSDENLEDYCLNYLLYKVDKKPVRAYFCRKSYEYFRHYATPTKKSRQDEKDEVLFMRKLPFVFEVVITIQYLHNHILDEKDDVKNQNHPKIYQNLISSNVLRELLFLYLEQEVAPLIKNRHTFQQINGIIRDLLLKVDLGQRIDKEYNNYWRWKSGVPGFIDNTFLYNEVAYELISPFIAEVKKSVSSKDTFIEAYFYRIYLTNVYFFKCIVEAVALLYGCCKYKRKQNLERFSIQYGFTLQIINDYSDFAYTEDPEERKMLKLSGKKTTDFLSDLYNFNITLPLAYHLQEGARRKIEAYLEGGKKKKALLAQYPRQIMQEIKQSGGIRYCMMLSRKLSDSARTYLDPKNPASDFFNNMCDIAIDNKFYKIFN